MRRLGVSQCLGTETIRRHVRLSMSGFTQSFEPMSGFTQNRVLATGAPTRDPSTWFGFLTASWPQDSQTFYVVAQSSKHECVRKKKKEIPAPHL